MTLKPEGAEEGHHHKMRNLSLSVQVVWILFTFMVMLVAAYLTTYVAPIKFTLNGSF